MADLADILNIKGNRPVYDRLRQLLKHGSATALVGAGASAGLYPLWPDLIAALANKPVELGLATETDEKHWLRVAEKNPLQAVQQIRSVLPDQYYYPFLFDTFKDREPHYTKTHSVLMRMNFRAWLTTNYDSGLIAAGRLNRYTVWNSNYEINRWLSGDVFKEGRQLVLFAHGYYADPPGIILDRGSYRDAYKSGPYRRLFESLWLQHEMVFVGFSFNDVVLGQIADEVLHDAGVPAVRHIAILGLSEEYTPELRKEFLDPYNAEILFYPVKGKDHSALATLLESLVPSVPASAPDARQMIFDSQSAVVDIPETRRTARHSIGRRFFGGISAEANKLVCGIGNGPDDMETIQFPISEPQASIESAMAFFRARGALKAIGISSVSTGLPKEFGSFWPNSWKDFDLVGAVQAALNVPVALDAHFNATALAEVQWGRARGVSDFLYVTVATWIAAGAIANGEIVHGLSLPDMGHVRVPHDLVRDPFAGVCPYHGDCLEGLASGPTIAARWGVPLRKLPPDHPAWLLEAHYLALGLNNWLCVLSPELTIFGGSLMEHGALVPLIRQELGQLLNGYKRSGDVMPSGLGARAGILGALALAAKAANGEPGR